MKKRLLYAMPRVPLQQLQEQQQEGNMAEPIGKPASKLKALKAKFLGCMKKSRLQRTPNRLIDESDDEEMVPLGQEETQLDASAAAPAAAPIGRQDTKTHTDKEHFECKEEQHPRGKCKTKQLVGNHLNIEEEDLSAIHKMEIKLQKANRGRKLRVVVVESDSEDENDTGQDNSLGRNYDLPDKEEDESPDDQGGCFVIQADVHQADSVQFYEEQGATTFEMKVVESFLSPPDTIRNKNREGAMEMRNQNTFEFDHSSGPRPEKNCVEWKQEERSKQRQKRRRHQERMEKEQSEVNWGLDESSESDGVWDCDDIRLFSR